MAFIVDRNQANSDHNGKLESFSVDAGHTTLLAAGDVVRLTGTASTDGIAGIDAATVTVGGTPVTGIVTSFTPTFVGENLTETGLPASTAGTAQVSIGTDVVYIADVSNGTLAATNVGQNINLVATDATKVGGLTRSNMTVDAGTAAGTATLPFRIVGLVTSPDGAVDTSKVKVKINASTDKAGATGV